MKNAREIRSDAWKALAEGGQYLRFVSAYMLLALIACTMTIPLTGILVVGIGLSGIAPYFAPGGEPGIGLLFDPQVMVPLSVSALLFSLLSIFPLGFFSWSQSSMSMAAMRRGLTMGHALSGWGHGWKMGWIMAVKLTYINLWGLLFVIPGIVKALSYAMTEYIAVDNPDWTANQCIAESKRLMEGNRLRYFCMLLSFAGWLALACIAGYIPIVGAFAQWFLIPYLETAKAAFYEELLDVDDAMAENG
ncbi:MAG: DUF975 family protein [Kiritimatiellae bacterium]|nr:DUF975 family protein [Kiritimatiellia bacterium]